MDKMDNMFSRKSGAKFLGISVVQLDRIRKQGEIAYVQIGRRVLFAKSHLIAYANSRVIPAKTDGGENDGNA
jgi:hypothetical protein